VLADLSLELADVLAPLEVAESVAVPAQEDSASAVIPAMAMTDIRVGDMDT
jgi:hypothetical protein